MFTQRRKDEDAVIIVKRKRAKIIQESDDSDRENECDNKKKVEKVDIKPKHKSSTNSISDFCPVENETDTIDASTV